MFRNPFQGAFSQYPVVTNLLMINVLLLLATWVFRASLGVDLVEYLALYHPASAYFKPMQLVTHMFMHANFTHLFFNMFSLYMFGRVIEQYWGGKRFFLYFFVTGLGAAGLHLLVQHVELLIIQQRMAEVMVNLTPETLSGFLRRSFPEYLPQLGGYGILEGELEGDALRVQTESLFSQLLKLQRDIPTVGASGAVYGVLLAFGMLFPNATVYLVIPPIPLKAKWLVVIFAALELYLGVSQPGSNIAHFAHLGGMLFGYILIKYWRRHGY